MLKSTLYRSLKDTKLKITPTCFGSYAIHHQRVWSCTWLKLFIVVHRCTWSVFGRVIFETVVCVYTVRTVHTHARI